MAYLRPRRQKSNVRYAKRGLGLCGYSNYNFDQMAGDLAFIQDQFGRSGIGLIEPSFSQDFREHFMLSASNNYFTPLKAVPYETYMPYSADEDPFGSLHKCVLACKDRMPVVRVKDNEVLYFKKVTNIDVEGRL